VSAVKRLSANPSGIKPVPGAVLRLCVAGVFLLCAGCGASGAKIVRIWTDQSVVALYAGYFNSAQDKYKAEVFYFENVCEHLAETMPKGRDGPDIVIGNWLNSNSALGLFRPIAPYYRESGALTSVFYPGLLEGGRFKKRQVLLPVSFDIYALVFDRNNFTLLPDPFSINMNDIQQIAADYNLAHQGDWTRIGFSPLWHEDFLFLNSELLGVNWREAEPIAWDDEKLQETLEALREWIVIANDSIQADDDFFFKYFYEPPDKLAASGRILFAFTKVSDFFKLTEERRAAVDFRWIEHENKIIPAENIVHYGIYRHSPSKNAAAAFTGWFFNEETQRFLLAKGKATRSAESFFGIANGFSAMRSVTESVFAQYYTGMLGHAPPAEKIIAPGVFPPFFPEIKERVILPYLREKIRSNSTFKVRTLDLRLADWVRTG
jgi:ABC-type glycerol-3-phosphate transport system substrate-binding protein